MRNPLVRATLILITASLLAPHLNSTGLMVCLGFGLFCYFFGRLAIVRVLASSAPTLFLLASSFILLSSATTSIWLLEISESRNISRFTREKSPLTINIVARVRVVEIRNENVLVVLDRLELLLQNRAFPIMGRLKTEFKISEGRFDPEVIRPGTLVELSGQLLSLPRKSNPHDFAEASYLRSRGINGILVPDGNVRLGHKRQARVWYIPDPSTWLIRLRDRLTRHLLSIHKSSAAKQLLPAMLLGQRYFIERDVREQFRVSGLSHLLAISGLHVGILGYSFFWFTGLYLARLRFPLALQRWLRAILSIALLVLFSGLAGASASVVRASVMGSVLILGTAVERAHAGLNSMGLAAFILLFFEPRLILTPGFQLSFVAVSTILMLGSTSGLNSISVLLKKVNLPFLLPVYSLFRISFWIFCTTFPIVSFHFGTASSGGILANLIAIPLASFLMISGLFSTLFSFIEAPLWPVFVSATDVLSDLMLSLARHTSSLLDTSFLSASQLESAQGRLPLVNMAPVGFFFLIRRRRLAVGSKMLWAFTALTIIFITARGHAAESFVTFLDVGQGDASFIRSASGVCVVVDTGPGYSSSSSVLRHAKATGCESIDPVIISHAHADHIGGLERLINSGIVGSVIIAFQEKNKGSESGWRTAARLNGVHIRHVSAGDVLSIDHSMKLYFLSPGISIQKVARDRIRSINNSSIVVLLRTTHSSVLFTGDAERLQERELIARYGDLLRSEVVKVAHHGSVTSSIKLFVDRVTIPDSTFAIISSGMNNRFGHPSPLVVIRWTKSGSEVLLTSKQGAVTYKLDTGRIVPYVPQVP